MLKFEWVLMNVANVEHRAKLMRIRSDISIKILTASDLASNPLSKICLNSIGRL